MSPGSCVFVDQIHGVAVDAVAVDRDLDRDLNDGHREVQTSFRDLALFVSFRRGRSENAARNAAFTSLHQLLR